MSEEVVADLKEFISGAITQQTLTLRQAIQQLDKRVGSLESRFDNLESRFDSLEQKVDSLELKVDDGFAAIAEILENMNTHNSVLEVRLNNHSKRLTHIEQNYM